MKDQEITKYPNFFIIGFQKSATSTLHTLLKATNQISLPINKETHFFSDEIIFNRGIDWYTKQFFFNGKHKIVGEVDPSYIYIDKVASNIKQYIENPKFILILRKPIDRAYSHYKMSCTRGYEKNTFVDALNLEEKRLSSGDDFKIKNFSYKDRGNYAFQISRFKGVFSDSEFLYLDFDNLSDENNRNKLILSLLAFIDIDIDENFNFNIHENKASKIRFRFIQKLLYTNYSFRRFVSKIIKSDILKSKIKNLIVNLNSKSFQDSIDNTLDYNALPKNIIDWNNKEVIKLENILGKDLKKWII